MSHPIEYVLNVTQMINIYAILDSILTERVGIMF